MNQNINASNVEFFTLAKEFSASWKFNYYPIPEIKNKFLQNYTYYNIVEKYRNRKRIYKKLNMVICIAILVIIILDAFG